MTNASVCEAVITGPTGAVMPEIARELVATRLAASAHVFTTPIESTYWWKGKIETATETRVHVVTRLDLIDRVTALVRERHPYAVPHITATGIIAGDPEFIAWIHRETLTPASS